MKTIIEKFKRQYGYEPSMKELHSLYTQGELSLTDSEEDSLLEYFEQ